MSQACSRRLSKLGDAVVVGCDREQFEWEKRYYHNLPCLSNLALMILIRVGQKKT